MPQQLARDGTGCHPHRRLPRTGATAAAIVTDAVLAQVGIVGVSRPELLGDFAIVLGALILIVDHEADGGAGAPPFKDAGLDCHAIGLAPLGRVAGLSGAPLVEPWLDIVFAQGNERRHAVDDTADRRPVALPPGGEAKCLTEGVSGHDGPIPAS